MARKEKWKLKTQSLIILIVKLKRWKLKKMTYVKISSTNPIKLSRSTPYLKKNRLIVLNRTKISKLWRKAKVKKKRKSRLLALTNVRLRANNKNSLENPLENTLLRRTKFLWEATSKRR